MRAIVAFVSSLFALMVGFWTLNEQAAGASQAVSTTAGNTSYNITLKVFQGVGETFAYSQPLMGVAALIAISFGLLLVVSGGAR